MTINIKNRKYTEEEYFDIQAQSDEKLEYHHGKIIAMPGGTALHNEIALKIGALLLFALKSKEKKYKVYNSDMRIQIPNVEKYVYPDAVVVCEKPLFYKERRDIIVNPLLVVEVLSAGTAEYDRGNKFHHYRTISTFKEYLLLEQDFVGATSIYREEENLWRTSDARSMDQKIYLKSIDCEIALGDIYGDVAFEE